MHFVKFHTEVASCLLSRGKRKYAPLGMRLLWKYIRNYFLVYQLISPFLVNLQNYKEFEAEILDLQSEKYGLSFDIKKYTTSGWALGDENVIGIRAFNVQTSSHYLNIQGKLLRQLFTVKQNDMFSFDSQQWCAFWQKIDMLLKWSIQSPNHKEKHIISRIQFFYMSFESLLFVIRLCTLMNRLTG